MCYRSDKWEVQIKERDETIGARRRQPGSLRPQPRLNAGGMTDGACCDEEHHEESRDHGLSSSGKPIDAERGT
jgi:hypothetical protein